jgi:hypothetical protein
LFTDKIQNNVPQDERLDSSFARELTRMVLSQVSGHPSIAEQTTQTLAPLLKRLFRNSKQQLASIHEIQSNGISIAIIELI